MIEETRKETFDAVERLHWEAMASEWEGDKARILRAMAGSGPELLDMTRASVRPETSRVHDSTSAVAGSALNATELAFAEEVTGYNAALNAGGIKPNLVDKFAGLFPEEQVRRQS